MLKGWIVVGVALAYIGLLFLVASLGDRWRHARQGMPRKIIYPLSLAIYCTSWTFFGSVGLASRTGLEFLTIYVGPVLMVGLCYPLLVRVMRLAKAHNITSIADFLAARYGKSQAVAATVALIAILGSIPYIALQLKAVSASLSTILLHNGIAGSDNWAPFGDLSLLVALAMAAFAALFGTRHSDATEHQQGLMLAVATESIVKLVAFVAVGACVTFVMFDGPRDLFAQAAAQGPSAAIFGRQPPLSTVATMTLLSFFAILLLPRQFHVAIVENQGDAEIRRAAWLFPLYLVLINLFVVPIALAGMIKFPAGEVDSDMFVLALPLSAHSEIMTLVAFVGGLSAATAMVIVETVALAIMVSNDIVMPLVLKRRDALAHGNADVGASLLLRVRRCAIFAILVLAYIYYRSSGDAQLAAIGLLSFAAIAQFAPSFFIGLVWPRATARGAIAGMVAGTAAWAYTLLLPSFADAGLFSADVVLRGPLGIAMLRPQSLFGIELAPLVHGVFWSLGLNLVTFVAFSLARAPRAIERVQASAFVPSDLAPVAPSFRLWRTAVTVGELTATVARYLGEERTRSSFESFAATRRSSLEPSLEADIHLLRYAEHILASAIGAASSRIVLSLLLRKRTVSREAALKLLDEANAAIHYNRELLQTALEHVRQGIAVFDPDLRLICWNRRFGEILDVPPERVHVGATLQDILAAMAERAGLDEAGREAFVRERVPHYGRAGTSYLERFAERGLVIEVRANLMPDGGVVTMFTDITESVQAAEALERANETLERRVRERTEELTGLNAELAYAKAEADEANISKTRFLAAASHDILQPLNAARLYVTSLLERETEGEGRRLAANVDASLEAVEEILGVLLDISRLDSGVMTPQPSDFEAGGLLRQLALEFEPMARERNLTLTILPSTLMVRSDRRLLRRLLQNLISNALKYTPQGRVLVGCRRRGAQVEIGIYDTGVGIPASENRAIFQEFHRLDAGARVARGLGLGLSIVERLARVLGHDVDFRSTVGRGSHFWVTLARADGTAGAVEPLPARRLEPGHLNGMAVLCIDNEEAILDGMASLLTRWGCSVVAAPGLKAAEALLDNDWRPSGVLVDYHLDEGDGLEVIAALRARYGEHLAAILVTADRSPDLRERARAQDIKVLNKPVRPAALRALLAQWRVHSAVAAE